MEYLTIVFCDGASSGNPGPGGWGTIVATPDGQVRELGGAEGPVTNNQMELTAAIRALEALGGRTGRAAVYTDSTYVIRGITQWIWAWRKRGWKTAEGNGVSNAELWKRLFALAASRGAGSIDWRYVRGHAGVPGNERVDAIAVAFSRRERPRLYSGPLSGYSIPIHDVPERTELPPLEARPQGSKALKAPAYSYLSVVGGVPERHPSWAECERRVKGRSGARFKKAMSAEEEAGILASWGFAPEDVAGKG